MNDFTMSDEIPMPVLFNAFKHHRNYILRAVRLETRESLIKMMEPICNNYVDVYFGELPPNLIAGKVLSILDIKGLLSPGEFGRWVSFSKGYRKIILDDGSEWIIRRSDNEERYIHIHPARSCPLTNRFRGASLKTVCLLKNISGDLHLPLELGQVNAARNLIALSPIKSLELNKGITNCFAKFFEGC